MPLGRIAIAAALIAGLGEAAADPASRDASVSLGAGAMTTRGSLGDERVVTLSASGSWFPDDGHFGARAHLGFARNSGGTTLVNSDRLSSLAAVLGAARVRLGGPFYAFAGGGSGAVLLRTHHSVAGDERTVWSTHPALTWTAGLELIHEELALRVDHLGAWSSASRDLVHSIHIGTVF